MIKITHSAYLQHTGNKETTNLNLHVSGKANFDLKNQAGTVWRRESEVGPSDAEHRNVNWFTHRKKAPLHPFPAQAGKHWEQVWDPLGQGVASGAWKEGPESTQRCRWQTWDDNERCEFSGSVMEGKKKQVSEIQGPPEKI